MQIADIGRNAGVNIDNDDINKHSGIKKDWPL